MNIYDWTGNPFVDAGIAAILAVNEKKAPQTIDLNDIETCINIIQKLYLTEKWKKNLYSVFPNNPITNASVKNSRDVYENFIRILFDSLKERGTQGNCIACGSRDADQKANRMHLPLTGYEGSHYFSFKAKGNDLCSACLLAIQFSPLTFFACGKLALIHSNSPKVMRYWAKKCIKNARQQLVVKQFDGCLNEGFINPVNALFKIATDLVQIREENWSEENASIRIYHFTNYNQGPDLDIYDLPAPVFNFIANARIAGGLKYWQQIVKKGYLRKTDTGDDEDAIKKYKNDVFIRLLNGQSILLYFYNTQSKKVTGNWQFLKIYLKEVLKMDEKRIQTIRKIGDEISELIKSSPNGKKRLSQLEMARNYHTCRMVLLRFVQDRVAQKAPDPLFTFDDYVESLFPEGANGWNETRDLILFRIYENLHQWLINEGIVPIEEDEEEEELSHN